MTHADTLERALRLLARSRRVLDYMADELHQGRSLNRNDAGIAEDLAGEIVALIGHSVTDQPEADEMFALREYLDNLAESEPEPAGYRKAWDTWAAAVEANEPRERLRELWDAMNATLPAVDYSESAEDPQPVCLCRFTHEGWVNTLCPRHRGDDER